MDAQWDGMVADSELGTIRYLLPSPLIKRRYLLKSHPRKIKNRLVF